MSFTIDISFENFDIFNYLYKFEIEFKNLVNFDKHTILNIDRKKIIKKS
jgi:hypothetical protein